MVFFLYKKAPLLLFSSSKSEIQLSMKNEEAGHECVIWFQLAQMGYSVLVKLFH